MLKNLLFLIFCIFYSSVAIAAETRIMKYDVYAGGIHALNAQLNIKHDKNNYDVTLNSATRGFLGKMAPWSGEFKTVGIIDKNLQIFPKVHTSSSTWKKEIETKTFTYDGRGNFVSYKKDNKIGEDISPELTKNTTDILSATFAMMRKEPLCTGKDLIFDGDRNYTLKFHTPVPEQLTKNDYNVFDGLSTYCMVEVTPEKGKWRKKPRGWLSIQEQGRQKGALPTIWFGKIDDEYIPVKIRVKTDYGILFMHLTSYSTIFHK